jgi:hypothetical protein
MPLHSLSLRNFLSFWRLIKDKAHEPEIVLCANGNIQAEWYRNESNALFIEFCDKEKKTIFSFMNEDKQSDGLEDLDNLSRMFLSRKNNIPFFWTYEQEAQTTA